MIVRVCGERDRSTPAAALTVVLALGLAAVTAQDLVGLRFGAPSALEYALVTVAMLLAAMAPWSALPKRPRLARLRCEAGALLIDGLVIRAENVQALSIARAERGFSVALDLHVDELPRAHRLVFVEVDGLRDALDIARALEHQGLRSRVPAAARPGRAVLRMGLALALGTMAMLYGLAALATTYGLDKSTFGLVAVVLAQCLAIEAVLPRGLRRRPVAMYLGASYDAHAALHEDASRRVHVAEAEPALEADHTLLARRQDEGVHAWFARLDASPRPDAHAGIYRGTGLDRNELWETLRGASTEIDEKMAAARLLRLHHGEAQEALVRVVTDPDERARVEAAMDEPEGAEARLRAMGPFFRTR